MDGLGARCDQERPIGMPLSVFKLNALLLRVERHDTCLRDQLDAPLAVEVGRAQRYPIFLRRAGQKILREIRPINRRRVVGAEHRDRSVVSHAAKHVCGGKTRSASANYHDRRRRRTRGQPRRYRLRLSFSDVRRVSDALDAPAGNWIQCGSAQRFAGTHAETRMMPWTPDGVADDQAFDQRAVVVRAVAAKGEQAIACSNEYYVVFIDPSQDLSSVRKILNRESVSEIGQLAGRFGHLETPSRSIALQSLSGRHR